MVMNRSVPPKITSAIENISPSRNGPFATAPLIAVIIAS